MLLAACALVVFASITFAAALLFAPAQVITPLAQRFATNEGIILQRFTLGTPWLTLPEDDGLFLLSFAQTEAHIPNASLTIENAQLRFSIADIVAGKMTQIFAQEARLHYQLAPNRTANTSPSPALIFDWQDELNALIANLPVDSVQIASLSAEISDGSPALPLATIAADTVALSPGTPNSSLSLNFSTHATPALVTALPLALRPYANIAATGSLAHGAETTLLVDVVSDKRTTDPLLSISIDLEPRGLAAAVVLNPQEISRNYPSLSDTLSRDYGIALDTESLSTIEFGVTFSESELALMSRGPAPFVTMALTHDLLEDRGTLTLQAQPPAFSADRPLSAFIDLSALGFSSPTKELVDGSVKLRADIAWHRTKDANWTFSGPITVTANELSGVVGETLFVGASTELTVEANLRSGPSGSLALTTSRPAALKIARVDSGFVFEEAHLNYALSLGPTPLSAGDTPAYRVIASDLGARFLGGEVSLPTFQMSESDAPQDLDLVLTGVDLNTLVQLANTPEVVVSGLISGYLPLRLNPDSDGSAITVRDGLISALKPGGSIRYSPLGGIASTNQSVQLVNQALANYQFTTLDTTLQIDDSGEIVLGVALAGANPDMNAGQAINLNVTITDNLLDLVSSLRASRDLTEALERRLAQ